MSEPKEQKPKSKFALLLDWAQRDKICAMAVVLGVIGVFPHLAQFILDFATILLPAVASATGLK